MKKESILKILFILFVSVHWQIKAQNLLWNQEDIARNEEDLVKAFTKYERKPSKEKFKTEFLNQFKERTAFHQAVIEAIKKEPDSKKDWLNWINRVRSLQFIYDTTGPVLTSNNIPQQQFNAVLDSLKQGAVKNLYAKGVKALDNHHHADSYRALSIVQQLHPGYEKAEELLQVLKLEANKKAYLKPLEMSNQGNYFSVSLSGASSMDEYVREHITRDLNQKVIGFKIDEERISTPDYEISLNWKNINLGGETSFKNTEERTAKINNNIVKATVTYDTRKFNVSSSFEVVITDKLSGRVIDSRTINGSNFAEYVVVTYTGDRNALTYNDLEKVNKSKFSNVGNFQQQFIYSFYDNNLHPQICDFINKTIGW